MKISLAVGAYAIAQFICTILGLAYTTLLQKVIRYAYACDYRTYIKYHKVSIILSHSAAGGVAVGLT